MEDEHIQVTDSVGQGDSIDTPMYRHYRLRPYHLAKDLDSVYDVERLVEEHRDQLIRSARDLGHNQSGQKNKLTWANLLFDRGGGIFWHVRVKNSHYSLGPTYSVIVMAGDPETAAGELDYLAKNFRRATDDDYPGFFMLTQQVDRYGRGHETSRVPIRENSLHDGTELELHYGKGFTEWSSAFEAGLAETGLSILRGAPGTGKTSYLRHLIAKLTDTHRFYYLSPDSYGLLGNDNFPELWKNEADQHQNAIPVIVIEDAENLLMERVAGAHNPVSTLLNLTDGFIGDLVRVHIICTLNCDVASLDDAILRPGRQKFFREFTALSYEQSAALAAHLGVTLAEEKEYTLAEIYHHEAASRDLLAKKRQGTAGFQP